MCQGLNAHEHVRTSPKDCYQFVAMANFCHFRFTKCSIIHDFHFYVRPKQRRQCLRRRAFDDDQLVVSLCKLSFPSGDSTCWSDPHESATRQGNVLGGKIQFSDCGSHQFETPLLCHDCRLMAYRRAHVCASVALNENWPLCERPILKRAFLLS